MKVVCEYSHMGGSEILEQRYPKIDKEIYDVINEVVGEKSKVSKEKIKKGKLLYSPSVFRTEFKNGFESKSFDVLIKNYDYKTCGSSKKVKAYKKFDFHKNKVAVQVQFGKYSFMMYDLAKFQYFYNENLIEVGVEIVPCLNLQKQMSSGMSYGEQLISDILLLKKQFPIAPIKVILVDVEEQMNHGISDEEDNLDNILFRD
jgi:hypothetical protein